MLEVSPYKPPDSDVNILAVSEIKVAGQPVTPGRPFFAGEDWLRSLTVRVRNTSAKPIRFVRISFGLPEAVYRAGSVGFHFRYGRDPADSGRDATAVKPLPPGGEAELNFTDEEYEARMSSAGRLSRVVSFRRVRLGTAFVVFADGTRVIVPDPMNALKEKK